MTDFITVPLRRGFTEIRAIFDIVRQYDLMVCGGYARYCASTLPLDRIVPASDVDIFPKDPTEDRISWIVAQFIGMGYEVKHENEVSVSFKPKEDATELQSLPIPQLIKSMIKGKVVTQGTPEEVLSNFDFTITRACILDSTKVLVDKDFESDEKHKKLRLKNIHCPVSSLLRCCKYVRKGYFLSPSEAMKLFIDWNGRGQEYQDRLIELFTKSEDGKVSEDNPDGMTQEQIDELEALLRID